MKSPHPPAAFAHMLPGLPVLPGALCPDFDPTLWTEHDDTAGVRSDVDPARTRFAKGICARCPARDDCAEYGIAHPEEVGIWGGLTHPERITLARRRQPRAG